MGAKLHRTAEGLYAFHCPGCECGHQVRVSGLSPVWEWNGSMDAPTLSPSILLRSGHYDPNRPPGECWCTYNAKHEDDPSPFKCSVCHSFVKEGNIQFCDDCTHGLKGRTVPLPDWE